MKYCRLLFLVGLVFCFLFFPVKALALEAEVADKEGEVVVTEETRNFYTAARLIDISGNARGDLKVVGGEVKITSKIVEGSILAIGGTVRINSEVDDWVTVVGEEVRLSGKYHGDVKIFGSKVDLKGVEVDGSLTVYTDKFIMEDSVIRGELEGQYGKSESDLKDQVEGGFAIEKGGIISSAGGLVGNIRNLDVSDGGIFVRISWQFGNIVFLIIVTIFLAKRNRLEMVEIKPDKKFLKDLLRGSLSMIIPVFVLIFSIITLTFFQVSLLTTTIYIFFGISSIFLPIYFANLVRNAFNIKLKVKYLVPIAFLVIFLIKEIPYFGSGFFYFLAIANFGFLINEAKRIFDEALVAKPLDKKE